MPQLVYSTEFIVPGKKERGFTLIELLVVIAIIAVLAVSGAAVYSNVTKSARDTKRKADIQAISKAYENNYNIDTKQYINIGSNSFSSGSTPQDPRTNNYYNVRANDGSGYRVCAALEGNPSNICNSNSASCYCLDSLQGKTNTSAGFTGNGYSQLGYSSNSIIHPSSCDPNGTLDDGLIGYWKMDETSWAGVAGEVKDTTSNSLNGTALGGVNTAAGRFNNAGSFNGATGFLEFGNPLALQITGLVSVSAWIKTSASTYGVIYSRFSHTGGCYPANNGYILGTVSSNANASFGAANGGVGAGAIGTRTINNGAWHHVVGVFDSTNNVLYVDGTSDSNATAGISSIGVPNTNVNIGRSYCYDPGPTGGGYFTGQIDDVRVYNRVLTGQEITAIYNGCLPTNP